MWRALAAEPGRPFRTLERLADVREAFSSEKTLLWLDLCQPDAAETALLTEPFRLHPLVIEDCVADVHHPKVDGYEDYLSLVTHGVRAGAARGGVETIELDVVLARRWMITFRTEAMRSVEETWTRYVRPDGMTVKGTDELLQSILAVQAAHHLEEIERLQDDQAGLQQALFGPGRRPPLSRLFEVQRDVARLRQIMGAQREVLHRLSRGEFPQISRGILMHYRDVYDDLYRASELLGMLHDIAGATLNTHLTLAANATNETMKVLTVISTFMLPLTLIVGWFGMNFENLHAIRWRFGELYGLSLLGAVTLVLWAFLRRRRLL